jgi:membrane dipeptidase
MSRWGISAQAAELHADALVWDMTLPIITPGSPELKAGLFARAAGAGFNVQSITLAVDGVDFQMAAGQVAYHRRFVQGQPETCVLVESADEIEQAREAGKLAVGLHFQGTAPFEESVGWVDIFYKLGIRHALMAYNEKNLVGCGCHVDEDSGLTDFGRELIREMNRVGMIVDCAHTGYRTTMETIEASDPESPAIVSHTNVRELRDHPRCLWDDQIRACAAKGGVMGITGIGAFLGEGAPTPERYVDHIDHIAKLVGPEHVGIGLDYVYDAESMNRFTAQLPDRYPPEQGYANLQQLELEDVPRVTEELLRRGYGEKEVRGILGENWLRVCRRIWK